MRYGYIGICIYFYIYICIYVYVYRGVYLYVYICTFVYIYIGRYLEPLADRPVPAVRRGGFKLGSCHPGFGPERYAFQFSGSRGREGGEYGTMRA